MKRLKKSEPYILASASPRRKEIMTLLGLSFEVNPASGEPAADTSLPPRQAARRVARFKAEQIAEQLPRRTVIGADTIVVIDGEILGKPADEADAARLLRRLSGRVHRVYTGVWVCSRGTGAGFTRCSAVSFYDLTDREIDEYIRTGEPMDKAGAYGIQGRGLRFVRGITGDYYNVVGLPAAALYRFLRLTRNRGKKL